MKDNIHIGSVFGLLTVIQRKGFLGRIGIDFQPEFLCKCACGVEKKIRKYSLTLGKTTSCGCRGRNMHGDSKTKLYRKWTSMISRCRNPRQKNYYVKGIRVCDEWMDYDIFKKWSLENGYSDSLEIDRIDGSLGYSPSNCRYVDKITNQNNKPNIIRINYNEEHMPLMELSRKIGLSTTQVETARRRIQKGWDPYQAVFTPPGKTYLP